MASDRGTAEKHGWMGVVILGLLDSVEGLGRMLHNSPVEIRGDNNIIHA